MGSPLYGFRIGSSAKDRAEATRKHVMKGGSVDEHDLNPEDPTLTAEDELSEEELQQASGGFAQMAPNQTGGNAFAGW